MPTPLQAPAIIAGATSTDDRCPNERLLPRRPVGDGLARLALPAAQSWKAYVGEEVPVAR